MYLTQRTSFNSQCGGTWEIKLIIKNLTGKAQNYSPEEYLIMKADWWTVTALE